MRRTASIVAAVVAAACSSTSAAPAPTEAAARCANGAPAGSDACCADATCERGVCDRATGACVDPWVVECAGVEAGACSQAKPYVCQGDAPPTYDCGTCGCPDGETCEQGACIRADALALRRDERGLRTDMPLDDYFRFMGDMATSPAKTWVEAVEEIAARMRADARRVALNLGESHGSGDEQAVGLELVRAVAARGFSVRSIAIEGGKDPIVDPAPLADLGVTPLAIRGDLTNDAHCEAAVEQIGERLNTEAVFVQYSGSGHTSQEACFHTEHYSICQPPHIAECVAKAGRKAITVMLWDPEPWLTMTDNALLWRAGAKLPDVATFELELGATLAAWEKHFAAQVRDPRYDASVGGRDVNVRFVPSPRVDDVIVAFFPRPGRQPFLLRTFEAVWKVPALRTYLIDGAMRPQDCSVSWDRTPGKESYSIFCGKGDKELVATVNGSFEVTESTTK